MITAFFRPAPVTGLWKTSAGILGDLIVPADPSKVVGATLLTGDSLEAIVAAHGFTPSQHAARPAKPVPVPQAVSLGALRAALTPDQVSAVDAAIAAVPDAQQKHVLDSFWNFGGTDNAISRTSPALESLAAGVLKLTPAEIDALFIAAAAIAI